MVKIKKFCTLNSQRCFCLFGCLNFCASSELETLFYLLLHLCQHVFHQFAVIFLDFACVIKWHFFVSENFLFFFVCFFGVNTVASFVMLKIEIFLSWHKKKNNQILRATKVPVWCTKKKFLCFQNQWLEKPLMFFKQK